MKKRNKWIIITSICLIGFAVAWFTFLDEEIYWYRREHELKKEAKEYEKYINNHILVPETSGKTKEQVEIEFKQVGLVPNFVAEAPIEGAKKNVCSEIKDQPNVRLVKAHRLPREKEGYYATKGTPIIVNFYETDFDPIDSEDTDILDSSKQQHNSNDSKDSKPNGNIQKQLAEMSKDFDKLITQAENFSKDPKTYTVLNFTKFQTEYSQILLKLSDLEKTVDAENTTDEESMKIYTELLQKQAILTAALTNLPDDFSN